METPKGGGACRGGRPYASNSYVHLCTFTVIFTRRMVDSSRATGLGGGNRGGSPPLKKILKKPPGTAKNRAGTAYVGPMLGGPRLEHSIKYSARPYLLLMFTRRVVAPNRTGVCTWKRSGLYMETVETVLRRRGGAGGHCVRVCACMRVCWGE